MRKNRKAYIKALALTLALVSMTALFTSCGKKYYGEWYNVENPDAVLYINDDNTFYYDNESGPIHKTDNGIIVDTGYDSQLLTFTEWEGETALTDGDSIFIKNYDKLKKMQDEQLALYEQTDKDVRKMADDYFAKVAGKELKGELQTREVEGLISETADITFVVNKDMTYTLAAVIDSEDTGGVTHYEFNDKGTIAPLTEGQYFNYLSYNISDGSYEIKSAFRNKGSSNVWENNNSYTYPCLHKITFISADGADEDNLITPDEYTGKVVLSVDFRSLQSNETIIVDLNQ